MKLRREVRLQLVLERENFIASDASPFIEYTSNAVYLEDGEMAVIRLHKSMSVRKIKMIQGYS
jgi:glucosamine 6-phosphate synthetase-like amidotransferase/phosphosugar isomerase protein